MSSNTAPVHHIQLRRHQPTNPLSPASPFLHSSAKLTPCSIKTFYCLLPPSLVLHHFKNMISSSSSCSSSSSSSSLSSSSTPNSPSPQHHLHPSYLPPPLPTHEQPMDNYLSAFTEITPMMSIVRTTRNSRGGEGEGPSLSEVIRPPDPDSDDDSEPKNEGITSSSSSSSVVDARILRPRVSKKPKVNSKRMISSSNTTSSSSSSSRSSSTPNSPSPQHHLHSILRRGNPLYLSSESKKTAELITAQVELTSLAEKGLPLQNLMAALRRASQVSKDPDLLLHVGLESTTD